MYCCCYCYVLLLLQEILETSISTQHWRDIKGNELFAGKHMPFDTDTELLAVNGDDEDCLWPEHPTSKDYEGYTGNVGPTLE
jgi:hypothetical protein